MGAAISVFERKHPTATILADTRTPEGARKSLGEGVLPVVALMAQHQWLKTNPGVARATARAIKNAMQWMRGHSVEEIRAQIPEELRMQDADADLQAIRIVQRNLSKDGMTESGEPESILKFVAISNEKVRTSHIDLSKLYTNEFASGK